MAESKTPPPKLKNDAEIGGMRDAHRLDGIAMAPGTFADDVTLANSDFADMGVVVLATGEKEPKGWYPMERLTITGSRFARVGMVADLLRAELGTQYTVALNLASTVPGWLTSAGARPMSMGLDLQGGVHFLLEVDQKAAIEADSEVVLAGRGIHFEIWSKANFERVLNIETREDESDDLGIF